MACRYHKLPSELLTLELNEFNLNAVILLKAIEKQNEETEGIKSKQEGKTMPSSNVDYSKFNIHKITKKKDGK